MDVLFGKGGKQWKVPACYFEPVSGRRLDLGVHKLSGTWLSPNVPSPQDWVLVMNKVGE